MAFSVTAGLRICLFKALIVVVSEGRSLPNNCTDLVEASLDFRKSFQLHRPLELLASQERNEIDGSEGAIITLWLICEYASYAGRPFVMISRCNGVRVNNSCRELLVLLSVQKYIEQRT